MLLLDSTLKVIGNSAKTGGGISNENLSKIFDPYFTTKRTGSGLGLAIARENALLLGGELEVEAVKAAQ